MMKHDDWDWSFVVLLWVSSTCLHIFLIYLTLILFYFWQVEGRQESICSIQEDAIGSLHLLLDYSWDNALLTVRLIQAQDLVPHEAGSLADPYCKTMYPAQSQAAGADKGAQANVESRIRRRIFIWGASRRPSPQNIRDIDLWLWPVLQGRMSGTMWNTIGISWPFRESSIVERCYAIQEKRGGMLKDVSYLTFHFYFILTVSTSSSL